MSDLLKLQRDFAHHIFAKSNHKILHNTLHSNAEALGRLNIYRNNVLGNFESILSAVFVVTKKILGATEFDFIAAKYCRKFPSTSGDLNEFGAKFPHFLKSHQVKYLKDLAQLELLYHRSYFNSKKPQKFDLKNFSKISEENFSNLIFTLDSACVLFSSPFAIFSLWQKEHKIKNFTKAEFTLIRSNHIYFLTAEEFLFLTLIKKQKPLYKIYQELCKKTGKEIDIGKLINRFINNFVITDFCARI